MLKAYEQFLRVVVERWPETVTFDPAPRTQHTLATRLRMAIAALRAGNFIPTTFDPSQWPTAPVVVRETKDGKVTVGPKTAAPNIMSDATSIPAAQATDEVINAVILLHSIGFLTKPTVVETTRPINSTAKNVVILQQNNQTIIL